MNSETYKTLLNTAGVISALYLFLVGIAGMSSAIKNMGAGFAETVLTTTSNPFIALFIGVFATVLFQSSSTTTSLIVGMVSSGTLTISSSIPMVMGILELQLQILLYQLGILIKVKNSKELLQHQQYMIFLISLLL